jgi:hypothetical protein
MLSYIAQYQLYIFHYMHIFISVPDNPYQLKINILRGLIYI